MTSHQCGGNMKLLKRIDIIATYFSFETSLNATLLVKNFKNCSVSFLWLGPQKNRAASFNGLREALKRVLHVLSRPIFLWPQLHRPCCQHGFHRCARIYFAVSTPWSDCSILNPYFSGVCRRQQKLLMKAIEEAKDRGCSEHFVRLVWNVSRLLPL